MAVKTKAEIIQQITNFIGENKTDDAVSILEDISDSMPDDSENLRQQIEDLKKQNTENDNKWRQKYIDRFNNADDNETVSTKDENDNENKNSKPLTFENLFKEE